MTMPAIKPTCHLCGCTEFHERPGAVLDASALRILECSQCHLVTLSGFEHIRTDHYVESRMDGEAAPSIESWLLDADQDDQRRFRMRETALPCATLRDLCNASRPAYAWSSKCRIPRIRC